jgi:hypothetical protein
MPRLAAVKSRLYLKGTEKNYEKRSRILISGFRRDVDEICGLLGYYAALSGNCLPTFRDNISVPS